MKALYKPNDCVSLKNFAKALSGLVTESVEQHDGTYVYEVQVASKTPGQYVNIAVQEHDLEFVMRLVA